MKLGNVEGVVHLHRTVVNMACGLLGGLAATVLTHPFDVVKTSIHLTPKIYPNLLSTTHAIFANEGVAGFFKGILPRILRKSMSSAISWTVYEEIVRFYQ